MDADVVGWFAYLHDIKRENDFDGEEHGLRASLFVEEIRDSYLKELSDLQVHKLQKACQFHASLKTFGDAIINACFDADRLDLWRVGIIPSPERMASLNGAYIAEVVDFGRLRAK